MTEPLANARLATGWKPIDDALGGGLLPGTMTLVIGATGVGKTQLGMRWAFSDGQASRPAIIDLSSRGDSQSHREYAERLAGATVENEPLTVLDSESLFDKQRRPHTSLPFLGYEGKRVLRSQLGADEWDAWQSQLNRRLPILQQFVYRHLVHGTRRFIVDGIEPQDHPEDSLQLDLLEGVYHRMIRQDYDWLARDVLRQDFRRLSPQVDQHRYESREASVLVLVTTRESMLDQLIEKPLAQGDLAAGANTILLVGRLRQPDQGRNRGVLVAKHRGSACSDDVLPFRVDDRGWNFDPQGR